MKKILLLALCAGLVLSGSNVFAKIWRINNNTNETTADFTTVQAGHDAASAGDTLYLEGSPNNYGNLYCTKKLVILGPGYFLTENGIETINKETAKVSQFQLVDGSQGSKIMGLDFQSNQLIIYTSNIVIERNNFSQSPTWASSKDYYAGMVYLASQQANDILIRQNYGVQIYAPSYANTGILITNNMISVTGEDNTTSDCLVFHQYMTAVVKNNIFRRGTVNSHMSNFSNNIMVNGIFHQRDNMTSNNLANATQFGTEIGNQANVDMNTVFLGTGSNDGYWRLKAGSPAVGAGYGSTPEQPVDAGMYWGNTPYKLSGLIGIPVIYFINVQTVGSNTDPIDVTVKVRSSN